MTEMAKKMFQSSVSYTKIIRASLFVNIPASPLVTVLPLEINTNVIMCFKWYVDAERYIIPICNKHTRK